MKALNTYIIEKFQVSKDNIRTYFYHPETKDELIECIKDKIEKEGLGTEDKPLNLNDINTSKITDMSELFDAYEGALKDLSENGNFDISDWDVSNVKSMTSMFFNSGFNGDISDWDVSGVEDMSHMFSGSKFTGKHDGISNWDVSRVRNMRYMFYESEFNGDIKKWDVSNVENMELMFRNCPLYDDPPQWYKS